jgi:hypothetical protein
LLAVDVGWNWNWIIAVLFLVFMYRRNKTRMLWMGERVEWWSGGDGETEREEDEIDMHGWEADACCIDSSISVSIILIV